jgi:hypothetical protein
MTWKTGWFAQWRVPVIASGSVSVVIHDGDVMEGLRALSKESFV